jgi:hypothetical protein
MTGTGIRHIVVPGLALAMGLTLASVAAGQGATANAMHNARRLGGSTAFHTPPLRTAASLKAMVAKKGMAEDIRTVLRESGIPETADAVLATLAGAGSSVKGGFCDEATPADGTLVECEVQPGSTLLWMAYRPNATKGNRTPGRIESVRWAGKKPFKAFLFRVTNDYKIYTFILPMVCSNLSLMSVKVIEGEPVNVSVDRVCDPKTGILRATIKVGSKDLERVQRVSVAINGQPAGELTAPSWTFTSNKAGDYTFDATDTKGRPYTVARRTARLEACPPPPPPAPKQVVGPTCSVALSFVPVKGAYQINVDATRSTTGASGVAPAVTVELHDATGAMVGQKLVVGTSLSGKFTVRRPGAYHASATVSTPQVVKVGAYRYEGTATCDASVTVVKPAGGPTVFFDVLPGKDRRVRPIENTDLEFAQCSPLVGLKFGVAKRLQNDWVVAGTVGAAISLVTNNEKVKESVLFVDVEVNKYLTGGSFIGTGLSFWDLTRSDTFTPAWLLHFGLPLARNAKYPVFLVGEGRLFFDHIGDIRNNYQFWGGVRVQFPR